MVTFLFNKRHIARKIKEAIQVNNSSEQYKILLYLSEEMSTEHARRFQKGLKPSSVNCMSCSLSSIDGLLLFVDFSA